MLCAVSEVCVVCLSVRVRACVCVRTCVRARARARMCVCVRARVRETDHTKREVAQREAACPWSTLLSPPRAAGSSVLV